MASVTIRFMDTTIRGGSQRTRETYNITRFVYRSQASTSREGATLMNPFAILLIGMCVVIGGVILVRLHAFLALLLGALTVALLTPSAAIYDHELRAHAPVVQSAHSDTSTVHLKVSRGQQALAGENIVLRTDGKGSRLSTVATVAIKSLDKATDGSVIAHVESDMPNGPAEGRIRPGDRLIHHTLQDAADIESHRTIGARVAIGFGDTCLKIGILIAMAAIIGKCLLDSGAAERVVFSARQALGDKRAPLAFLGSGFLVGIPVFFDTVFYLLMPLGKALRVHTGRDYLLYILTITCGATMAHSLVPPTPGPLFVASELGVDVGLMMVAGCLVGICTVTVGYGYATWANRRWDIPIRPSAELTTEQLQAMAQRDVRELPPLWLSLLPILLPVLLIGGNTVFDMWMRGGAGTEVTKWADSLGPAVRTLGNKNVALVIAAAISLLTLAKQKQLRGAELNKRVQSALSGGGVIILITAAGGAFGHVLRQSGIASQIQHVVPATQLGILPLAFAVTAIVRIAQGSATVAMITAVGIVAPLASAGDLGFHPVYLALAIGCGSKPVSWMNDSGFWIVSQMSGMTATETLKTHSAALTVMGVAGLLATMAGAYLWPLV